MPHLLPRLRLVTQTAPRWALALSLLGAVACGDDTPSTDVGELSVSPAGQLTSSGPQAGPFSPARHSLTVKAEGGRVAWRAASPAEWLDLIPASGVAEDGSPAAFTIAISQGAYGLSPNTYSAEVTLENLDDSGNTVTINVTLAVGASTTLMTVTPTTGLSSLGDVGGPFSPAQVVYTVEAGDGNLNWEATADADWVDIRPSAGSVPAGGRASVTVALNQAAAMLDEGSYNGTLTFTNLSNPSDPPQTRPLALEVKVPVEMNVRPDEIFASSGDEGGPFVPARKNYRVEAFGADIDWEVSANVDWISFRGDTSGTIPRDGNVVVIPEINANADVLPRGNYSGLITFTNLTNGVGTTTRQAVLTVALPPEPFDLLAPADDTNDAPILPSFSWASSLGATTYRLEISTDSGFANIVETVTDIAVTNYTLGNPLAAGTRHYWRVIAVNTIGETTATNAPFAFTTGALPGAFDLTAPAAQATGVSITPSFTWTASSAVDSYELTVARDAALSNVVLSQTGITQTSFVPTSTLSSNTTYYWSVDAVNTTGRTTATNAPLPFTTGAAPGPFDLVAPADNATDVAATPMLSWSASAGAASYRVEVATDNTFGSIVATQNNVNGTSVTLGTTLPAGVLHFWRVFAVNAIGEVVAQNAPRRFTTIQNPNVFSLSAPVNNATNVALTPAFSWTALTGATSYTLQVASDSGFATVVATQANITGTSVTLGSALSGNTTYYWRVTAAPGGIVAQNAPFSFTTQGNAPGPFTLSAPANAETQPVSPLVLSWTNATGETGYTVQVASDAGFASVVLTGNVGVDVTSWTVTTGTLVRGTTYYWRVIANGAAGNTTATNAPFSFTVDYSRVGYAPGVLVAEAALDARVGGGYLAAGHVGAANPDFWAIALAANGAISWQTSIGGAGSEVLGSIHAAADGGALLTGYTSSAGSGADDAWLVRLTTTGTVAFQRVLGGNAADRAYAGRITADTGAILAGESASYGLGPTDGWVVKLNSTGGLQWSNAYGGAGSERFSDVRQTTDNGFVVAGQASSFGASTDAWVVRLQANGAVTWQYRYGGTAEDIATSVVQTADNGFAVAGITRSFGANANGEAWVFKLNAAGVMQWQNRIDVVAGGSASARIRQATGGDLLVAISENATGTGGTVVRLTSAGATAWQRRYGTNEKARTAIDSGGRVIVSGVDASVTPARLSLWNVRSAGTPLGASVTLPSVATATTAVATNGTVTVVTPVIADTNSVAASTNATIVRLSP